MSKKQNAKISRTAESSSGPSSSNSGTSSSHREQALASKKSGKGAAPTHKSGKAKKSGVKDLSSVKVTLLPIPPVMQYLPNHDYDWQHEDFGDPVRKVFEYFDLMTIREEHVEVRRHAHPAYLKKMPRDHKFFERVWDAHICNVANADDADILYGIFDAERPCIYLHSKIENKNGKEVTTRYSDVVAPDPEIIGIVGPSYCLVFYAFTGNPNMPRSTTFSTAQDLEWKDMGIRCIFDNGAGLPPDDDDSNDPPSEEANLESNGESPEVSQTEGSDGPASDVEDEHNNVIETPEPQGQGPASPQAAPTNAMASNASVGGMVPSTTNVHLPIPVLQSIFPNLHIAYTGTVPFWMNLPSWSINVLLFLLSWLKFFGTAFSIYSALQILYRLYTYVLAGPHKIRRFLPFKMNDYLFRWLYWSQTGYYEIEDPTPDNIFLDTKGNPDPAAHARYIASLVDATKHETPDLTNIIRSYSANPKRVGVNFVSAVCEDFTNAHMLDLKMQAANTWALFIKKTQNYNVYIALFHLTLLIVLTLPALVLFAYYIESYFITLAKIIVGIVFPTWTSLFKMVMKRMARLSPTAYELNPEVFDRIARQRAEMSGEFHSYLNEPFNAMPNIENLPELDLYTRILTHPDFVRYLAFGFFIPLFEESLKRVVVRVWSWSGLKCSSTVSGFLYGCFEAYDRYISARHDMSIMLRIFLHTWLGRLPFSVAVLAHGLWNCLVTYYSYDTYALAITLKISFIDNVDVFLHICLFIFCLVSASSMIVSLGSKCYQRWFGHTSQPPYDEITLDFRDYYRKPTTSAGVQIRPVCVGEVDLDCAPWNKVIKATGCHRRGSPSGYYSTGLNLKTAAPFCFAGCHHNCNAAGLYRMAGTPKRYLPPYGSPSDKARVEDFWHRLTPFLVALAGSTVEQLINVGETREITREEWLRRFNLKQAQAVMREYSLGSRSVQFDMFIKKEKSMSYNPAYDADWATVDTGRDSGYQTIIESGQIKFHPRGISVPRTDVRAHFGPSSNRLQNYLKLTFCNRILFASGYTRRKFSKWYEMVCTTPGDAYANVGDDLLYIRQTDEGAIIESMDASRFDQHTLACVLYCNAMIYKKLGWTEEYRYSKDTIDKIYKIRPGFGGGKGKIMVNGTQASGKWDTLGGNSLPMLGIATYCSTFSLNPREILFQAGYVCTGPSCSAFELKADFLQNLPYPSSDDGIRFGPKIGRIISRTFWHDHRLSPDKCLPFALGIMVGMANDIMHIPILNDLFNRLQELVQKPWFAKKKNVQALIQSDTPAREHQDCLNLLADRYGVGVDELQRYRTYIRRWTPGTFLDDGFEYLVYRIVKIDCD